MNKREKILLSIIAGAIGLFVVYKGFDWLFIRPITTSKARIIELTQENDRLDLLIKSRKNLVERWSRHAAQTLSFEKEEAADRLAHDIKRFAKQHGFELGSFSPASGSKVGSKTGITSVGNRVTAEGKFSQALEFLREIYHTPYISNITKLAISPIQKPGRGRDEVKIEFTVETPVLPRIDAKKEIPQAAKVTTMTTDPAAQLPSSRDYLLAPEAFALLKKRNIFRTYLPPPTNIVSIDNQDWNRVTVKYRFIWEGTEGEQLPEVIAGKSQKQVTGKGDAVEILGAYSDGKAFGPERLDFNAKKDWVYAIPVHSKPPEPTVVDLAVDNQAKEPIDVDITVTFKDGKTKKYPTMRFKAGAKEDVEKYEVKQVLCEATYASGKKASPKTLYPGPTKAVYVVPIEPAETVATAPRNVNDPPADATLMVSGLVTYSGRHELIATGGSGRKVIEAGVDGAVDGGKLLAVHPLGGVVKMPSGNYYIYPFGRKFSDRVKLTAAHDADLAAAIDSWSASPASASPPPSEPATGGPAVTTAAGGAKPGQNVTERPKPGPPGGAERPAGRGERTPASAVPAGRQR